MEILPICDYCGTRPATVFYRRSGTVYRQEQITRYCERCDEKVKAEDEERQNRWTGLMIFDTVFGAFLVFACLYGFASKIFFGR
jgi:hypothetical protein